MKHRYLKLNFLTVFLSACVISFSVLVYAERLDSIMHQLGQNMLALLPALYEDDSKIEEMKPLLIELQTLLDKAKPHLSQSDAGTKINFSMLRDQVQQAVKYSDHSNLPMLKSELSNALALCASCHNQDGNFVDQYGISKFRDLNEFLAAEYAYMTRDYGAALVSYQNHLKNKQINQKSMLVALDKLLIITLEVYGEPELAYSTFTTVRKNFDVSKPEMIQLDEWLKVIYRLVEEPDALHSPLSTRTIKQINAYLEHEWPVIQQTLSTNEQFVYWVAIRGKLNQLLRANTEKEDAAYLLYWLALSDRALNYRFYDSLSRHYLVQCIRGYPNHEMAKECYKEYEMLMIVSFSGSGGVFLPVDAQKELNVLRKLVYR
jgi:cytochrome c553